jgi:hypothetical protein
MTYFDKPPFESMVLYGKVPFLFNSGVKMGIFFGKTKELHACTVVMALLAYSGSADGESRYLNGRTHSVITKSVVTSIRAIVATGMKLGRHKARFIKVGDSITKSDAEPLTQPGSPFMCQFVCPDYTAESKAWDFTRNLDAFKGDLIPALQYFLSDTFSDGRSSFNRPSIAAAVGISADWAVSGSPSPLRKEIDAVNPQFAVIMYGANDAGGYGGLNNVLSDYRKGVCRIVDSCIASGVVPILTATCPRVDKMEYTLTMSYLVRAIAQQYQIPFIDYHHDMMLLPDYGLRGDGVHPNYMDYNKSCWLTKEGLKYGYNMRNLVTMQALNRMYQVITTNTEFIDAEPSVLTGKGTDESPFVVDAVPFIDAKSTSAALPMIIYKLILEKTMKARILVTSQIDAGVSVAIYNSNGILLTGSAAEPWIEKELAAGSYLVKIKTDGTKYGRYQFVLMDSSDDGKSDDITSVARAFENCRRFGAGSASASKSLIFMNGVPIQYQLEGVVDISGRNVMGFGLKSKFTTAYGTVPSTGLYILNYRKANFTEK